MKNQKKLNKTKKASPSVELKNESAKPKKKMQLKYKMKLI